jgi:hypothetical protein
MTLATDPPIRRSALACPLLVVGILALIAFVYWPVHLAWFIWDDKLLIHDNAWIAKGSDWWNIVVHGTSDWPYFRPLGLALLVAETRLFGIVPGPMHLLSLGLHLVNTALVAALAWQLLPSQVSAASSKRLICAATLIYGLHPILIEPIALIASQFDLLLTLFVLLGLYLNLVLQRSWVRAVCVTTCFLVAAIAKESAVAFPVLLVLLDWLQSDATETGIGDRLHALIRRQGFVYLGVFAAGIVYLALRYWVRTNAVPYPLEPFFEWSRFQSVCFTYMVYWRMIVWPFVGLAPAHIVSPAFFATINPVLLATDFGAVVMGLLGLLLAWRRHPAGMVIVGVTATLFPVLRVIPIDFEPSLYHERYAMPAIAWVCIWLPLLLTTIRIPAEQRSIAYKGCMTVTTCWLLLAAVTIRSTLPLWSNDNRCWHWALRTNPGSVFLMNVVMNIDLNDPDAVNLGEARALGNALMVEGRSCPDCMMDVANLAVLEGDAKRAAGALQLANTAMQQAGAVSHTQVIVYDILNGNVRVLSHDMGGAEAAFRDAISIDPMRPSSYFSLALALAGEGREAEARAVFAKSAGMSAPDVAAANRLKFDAALDARARTRAQH